MADVILIRGSLSLDWILGVFCMIDQVPMLLIHRKILTLCSTFLLLFLSSLTKTTYFFLDMDLGFSLLRKLFPNLPAFGEMGWVIRGTYPEEGGLRRAKYNCFINTGWRRHCNFLLLWLLRFLWFLFWQELPILYWLCHPLFSRCMVWYGY
jgi:hypothetical protein